MKIHLVSDLHVELHHSFPAPTAEVDVVVLAGDIHKGSGVFDVAEKFRRHCQAPVIIVAGNHEYYGKNYLAQLAEFRHLATLRRNVFFLENDRLFINGVRFLGCTLWSSFSLYGEDSILESQKAALRCIADFSVIRFGDRRFTPDDAMALHHESRSWLESQLAQPHDGRTVVITHFLPHRAGIHPMHAVKGGDELTPYFTTDLSSLMQRYKIDAWLYGHTHGSVDIVVENGTRLVSNQRGYAHERWSYTRFDSDKVIDLGDTDFGQRNEKLLSFEDLVASSGGCLSVRQAASLLARSQSTIQHMIRKNELLCFTHGLEWKLPALQFDVERCEVAQGLKQVLAALSHVTDTRDKVIFCLTSFESTNKTPLQLLNEGFDPEVLAMAATDYAPRRDG